MSHGHLLTPLPPRGASEILDTLLARDGVRVERIVSFGQATAEGVWYDQAEHEMVVLLQGAATLRIAGEAGAADEILHLTPGAWVDLPAHRRHRVDATQAEPPTVWLAVWLGEVVCSPDEAKRNPGQRRGSS
jgi:cupin 2 domain-containing protein